MQTKEYLEYIVDHIHSAVFATVDSQGRPVTCAIDLMDYDENSLYFLTAKGKNFYDRLKANENIAFTAMKGEDTLSCVRCPYRARQRRSGRTGCPTCSVKIPIWRRFILMCAPTARSQYSKFTREPENGLTSPNFLLNGPASFSAEHRQKKPAIL